MIGKVLRRFYPKVVPKNRVQIWGPTAPPQATHAQRYNIAQLPARAAWPTAYLCGVPCGRRGETVGRPLWHRRSR